MALLDADPSRAKFPCPAANVAKVPEYLFNLQSAMIYDSISFFNIKISNTIFLSMIDFEIIL